MTTTVETLPAMPAAFSRAVEDVARALSSADQLDRENLVSMVRDLENSFRSTADRTAWDLEAVQASVANQRRILQALQRLLLAPAAGNPE